MIDEIAETAPRKGYVEVEGKDSERIYLKCQCGQIIKKRRDSFIPGLHVAICLACHNISTEVELLGGEHVEQKPSDAKSADDFKGKTALGSP